MQIFAKVKRVPDDVCFIRYVSSKVTVRISHFVPRKWLLYNVPDYLSIIRRACTLNTSRRAGEENNSNARQHPARTAQLRLIPSHPPNRYEKAFSLPVDLARWRLADLPRLLAVDSRLSDRTVVRSRREFRQHAPEQARPLCSSKRRNIVR